MAFLYETNILNQPSEWRRVLDIPLPSGLSDLDFKRIYFIGIGSSFWLLKSLNSYGESMYKWMPLQYKATTLSTQDTLFLQMILSLCFHTEEPKPSA